MKTLSKKMYNEVRNLWFNSKRDANTVMQCNYNADKTVYSWEIGFLDFGHHTNYINKFVATSQKMNYTEIKNYLLSKS